MLVGALGVLGAGTASWLLFLRDQTTDSDATGEVVQALEVPQGAKELGARAVEVLSRHAGEHGNGPKGQPGYHRGRFIDEVNFGVHGDGKHLIGKPWCARAVRWAFETAAHEIGQGPPFAAVKGKLATASSWKGAPFEKFVLRTPKVGAVLVLGDQHATLVAKVLGPKEVVTIEGNHGDAVANVRRTIKPHDAVVDVESFVASAAASPRPSPIVAGLELLGAEDVLAPAVVGRLKLRHLGLDLLGAEDDSSLGFIRLRTS